MGLVDAGPHPGGFPVLLRALRARADAPRRAARPGGRCVFRGLRHPDRLPVRARRVRRSTYMILSLVAGVTSVLLAHQVRKRLQLLQAGIYVGAVTLVLGLLLGRLDITLVFRPGRHGPPASPRHRQRRRLRHRRLHRPAHQRPAADLRGRLPAHHRHQLAGTQRSRTTSCSARCSSRRRAPSTTAWWSPRWPKPPPRKSVPTPRCAASVRISTTSAN